MNTQGSTRPTWPARRMAGAVTGTGWLTLFVAVASWLVGWLLGWNEFMLIATAAGTLLVTAGVFIFGRAALDVSVEVKPQRVTVGERSAGEMLVTNRGTRRLLALQMELVVGDGAAEFDVPSLGRDETHDEVFVLPTERRGIVDVGPATSVRRDPLGILRRAVTWTEPLPLYVHPRTVPLGYLGAGLLRDLEGQPTTDLSPSDIAFHALREYETGDDRRFVHWLTTARVGRLMVRQFTDTRRAHLAVVLDGAASAFADEEEFETAVSIAASIGVRAISDDQEVSMAAAGRRIPCVSGQGMLDGLAGVDVGGPDAALATQADQLTRTATGISSAILITGSAPPVADLRSVTLRFPADVKTMAVRVDSRGTTGFRSVGGLKILTVTSLREFSQLLFAVNQS